MYRKTEYFSGPFNQGSLFVKGLGNKKPPRKAASVSGKQYLLVTKGTYLG